METISRRLGRHRPQGYSSIGTVMKPLRGNVVVSFPWGASHQHDLDLVAQLRTFKTQRPLFSPDVRADYHHESQRERGQTVRIFDAGDYRDKCEHAEFHSRPWAVCELLELSCSIVGPSERTQSHAQRIILLTSRLDGPPRQIRVFDAIPQPGFNPRSGGTKYAFGKTIRAFQAVGFSDLSDL